MNTDTDTNAHHPGTRLTRKKYAFRLPLALAARLEALCEMHPQKTRTQVIGDVLGLGLAEIERTRTGSGSGNVDTTAPPDPHQPIYLLYGPFAEFHHLAYKHHLALEKALAPDEAQVAPPVDGYALGDSE